MRVFVSDGVNDFEGDVRDDADLDGTFVIHCEDGKFSINGWLACELEVLDRNPFGWSVAG